MNRTDTETAAMHSPFSRILVALEDHISAALPEVWCDQYWGQDEASVRPMLAYPAVLVDIEGTSYSEMGGFSQFAECTVTLRLFCESYASSAARSPAQSRAKALEYLELEHRLVQAVQGWQPAGGLCQPLVRTADSSDNRKDLNLRIRTITFTTAFEYCFD